MFRTAAIVASTVIMLVSSQAPEFAQQYRQRLGGAIGELEPIVTNFDADAQRSDLSRAEALKMYGRSHEQFLRDRGKSMAEVFERYDRLVAHRAALDDAADLSRPLVVLGGYDGKIFNDTASAYSAAVPLGYAGIAYAAASFMLAMAAAFGLRHLWRRRRRQQRATAPVRSDLQGNTPP